jgi:hypothetical protein
MLEPVHSTHIGKCRATFWEIEPLLADSVAIVRERAERTVAYVRAQRPAR